MGLDIALFNGLISFGPEGHKFSQGLLLLCIY